jgi:predicted kinase
MGSGSFHPNIRCTPPAPAPTLTSKPDSPSYHADDDATMLALTKTVPRRRHPKTRSRRLRCGRERATMKYGRNRCRDRRLGDADHDMAMKQRSVTRLVLICGLPASGKTTLARQLARKIPAVRLDKDQWTTDLGHDVWDDEFRVRLERQLWALTEELLVQGQSVILEWGHWARAERDEKRLAARALGVGVELHYLDAPLEELIERAQRRNASGEWTASPMTPAHFERWAAIFQPPDEHELLLFDEPFTEP